MSIIRIEMINTFDKGNLTSREYKLWGIPLLKYTYKHKGNNSVKVVGASEGVPLEVGASTGKIIY